MNKPIRFIGRLLIISLLISAAVNKIKSPTKYKDTFISGYNTVKNQHSILRDNLPSVKQLQPYMIQFVRGVGIFQGMIALSLIFGDAIGGYMFLFYLVICFTSAHTIKDLIRNYQSKFPYMINSTILLGIALCAASKRYRN